MAKRMTQEDIVKTLEEKGCTYIAHYYKSNPHGKTDRKFLKVDYTCKEGHLREDMYFHGVKSAKFACAECTEKAIGDRRRFDLDKVKDVLAAFGMEYLSGDYVTNTSPLEIKCSCGSTYTTTLISVTHGNRCGCYRKGEHHYSYNHELTEEERQDRRQYTEYREWVKKVFDRDNYTCQKCGVRGTTLHAHHIYSYARFKEKRTELENGVTLCEGCHSDFHKKYGVHKFTAEDYMEWETL